MGAPNIEDLVYCPGRICIGPTDLSLAWPHGGTGLGVVESVVDVISRHTFPLWSLEHGAVLDEIELGEDHLLRFELRTQDQDAMQFAYNRLSAGAFSALNTAVWSPVTYTPGRKRSASAVKLLFTPDDPRLYHAWLAREAVVVGSSAPVESEMELGREWRYSLTFRGLPTSSGWAVQRGFLEDLTL